jgi:hypothetical protein
VLASLRQVVRTRDSFAAVDEGRLAAGGRGSKTLHCAQLRAKPPRHDCANTAFARARSARRCEAERVS